MHSDLLIKDFAFKHWNIVHLAELRRIIPISSTQRLCNGFLKTNDSCYQRRFPFVFAADDRNVERIRGWRPICFVIATPQLRCSSDGKDSVRVTAAFLWRNFEDFGLCVSCCGRWLSRCVRYFSWWWWSWCVCRRRRRRWRRWRQRQRRRRWFPLAVYERDT